MEYKEVLKTKKHSFLFRCLLAIFIIYITDCIAFEIGTDRLIVIGAKVILLLSGLLAMTAHILKYRTVNVNVLLVTVCVFLTMIVYGGYTSFGYFSFIAAFWFGYCYSKEYSLGDFSESFCIVMRIIAIASIIILLNARSLYNNNWFPYLISNRGEYYRFLYLSTIPFKRHMQYRNWGPFWEPGVYQVYLNVALFLTLFVRRNNKWKYSDSVLFVITGFTTFSGAFVVPMLLIVSAFALERNNIKAFKIFLTITILSALILYSGVFDNALNKMLNLNANSNFIYRFIALEGGVRGFLRNPILGSSDSINKAIKAELALKYTGYEYASNANTFANLFGYLGGYVGGYVVYKSFKMFDSVVRNRVALVLVFLAYLITTSNENLMSSTLVLTLCFLSNKDRFVLTEDNR